MAIQLPRVIEDLNAHVDGIGYAGRIDTIQLPTLQMNTEEYQGGGLDNPVDIHLGMQKPEVQLTFTDVDPELRKRVAMERLYIVARGAIREQGRGWDAHQQVKITMFGLWKSADQGSWERGSKNSQTYTCGLVYYREEQAGEELVEIDTMRHIRRIGGVDQLALQRQMLGL